MKGSFVKLHKVNLVVRISCHTFIGLFTMIEARKFLAHKDSQVILLA